jgi:hypothetical protein
VLVPFGDAASITAAALELIVNDAARQAMSELRMKKAGA